VILPEDFKMAGTEVYIKKVGNTIILIAKDNPWQSLFESLDQFSDDFMTTRDQLPLDVREAF
jgi:antitoxin VapB